jgi:hypothetical protein
MFDQAIALLDQASGLYDRAQPYITLALLLIIVATLALHNVAVRFSP